jgi:response regulator of citrate/malate metabolism
MVVEDDLFTSVALSKVIRLGIEDVLVLTARSLAEARLLLEEYVVNVFILDINLPDGSGMDFILDAAVKSPEATIAVTTATPLPEYRDRAQAFGVMNFLAKPVDNSRLLELIRESQKLAARSERGDATLKAKLNSIVRRLRGRNPGDTTFFKAKLSRLTVLDLIQLKCLSNSSHSLQFISMNHGSGSVYFQNGDIVHAETARARGMEALSEMIGWKGGRAEEKTDRWTGSPTISGNWQSALLSAAQAADEKQPDSAEAEP